MPVSFQEIPEDQYSILEEWIASDGSQQNSVDSHQNNPYATDTSFINLEVNDDSQIIDPNDFANYVSNEVYFPDLREGRVGVPAQVLQVVAGYDSLSGSIPRFAILAVEYTLQESVELQDGYDKPAPVAVPVDSFVAGFPDFVRQAGVYSVASTLRDGVSYEPQILNSVSFCVFDESDAEHWQDASVSVTLKDWDHDGKKDDQVVIVSLKDKVLKAYWISLAHFQTYIIEHNESASSDLTEAEAP